MNKTLRKAMLSTICMLVVAVVSLTGVTYAWFSQGTYSKVSGLDVQVESATGGILVAATKEYNTQTPTMPGASSYLTTLDLSTVLKMGDKAFGGAKGVKPVSTVGGASTWNFYTAEIDGATTIKTAADSDRANVFTCYLYLMNTGMGEALEINLGGNPGSVKTEISNSLTGNYIENAARLGLRYVATRTIDGKPADTAGTVNDTDGFGIFSNEGKVYKGIQGASSTPFDKNTVGTNVAEVTPKEADDWKIVVPNESIVVVELMVWVEGQDTACINANAGADFNVNLYFDRIPAAEEVTD